jgi:hypothetical protein
LQKRCYIIVGLIADNVEYLNLSVHTAKDQPEGTKDGWLQIQDRRKGPARQRRKDGA